MQHSVALKHHRCLLYPHNLLQIRSTEFAQAKDSVYLDHAGSTLYSSTQISSYMKDLQQNLYGNPHSVNSSGDQMCDIVHQIRCLILSHFNVTLDDYDVIFVSGATGALKVLADSFKWTAGLSKFVYLEDNHTSVVGIREIASSKGVSSFYLHHSKSEEQPPFCLSSHEVVCVKDCAFDKEVPTNERVLNLFAYPAQSNFSGCKYPLQWVDEVRQKDFHQFSESCDCESTKANCSNAWMVLLDAASYASTSPLDLKECTPDFVCLSFYKLFGFPTGLGALLVKLKSADALSGKVYFGGGTADGYLASHDYYKPRTKLHARLEDGTLPFLDILALKHGFDTLYKISGNSMLNIQSHTFSLTQRLYNGLTALVYRCGRSVIELYCSSDCSDSSRQGPILTFNVKRADGSYVGFNHVLQLASSRNMHLRGGCFCNAGACVSMLQLDPFLLKKAYSDGHVCGDAVDIADGHPLGAVRASLGYMSTSKDVDALIDFLKDCFVRTEEAEYEVYYDALSYVPSSDEKHVYLKEIYLYPVKSCRPMKVVEWFLCDTGLKYDRCWMVVNDHGVCLTLKREHRLTLIEPFIDLSARTLTLKADGFGSVILPLDQPTTSTNIPKRACQAKVCGDRVLGEDCGTEVAEWLCLVLGQPASLIRKRPDATRFSKLGGRDGQVGKLQTLALANEAQYLMVSLSTVDYLRRAMLEMNLSQDCLHTEDQVAPSNESVLEADTIVARFRCNFLLAGADAFTEESWSSLFIDSVVGGQQQWIKFHCAGLCSRCSMICVDQITGVPSVEPLRTLGSLPPAKIKDDNSSKRRNHFGVYLYTNCRDGIIKARSRITVQLLK